MPSFSPVVAASAALIVAAARLSYANIEPQRAKAAERRRVLEAFIHRKLGGGGSDPDPASASPQQQQQEEQDPPRST